MTKKDNETRLLDKLDHKRLHRHVGFGSESSFVNMAKRDGKTIFSAMEPFSGLKETRESPLNRHSRLINIVPPTTTLPIWN